MGDQFFSDFDSSLDNLADDQVKDMWYPGGNNSENGSFRYKDEQGNSVRCFTPNQCAFGGYAPPYRDLSNDVYSEFYGLSFIVIVLGVRVDQPYTSFRHQNNNEIRGVHNESTGFGHVGGPFNHYVTPIESQ